MTDSLYENLDKLISYGEDVQGALDFTLGLADSMGFRTKNIDNVIGYAEYGEGDEMIAVLGHLDIVPAGDGWNTDPFRLTEKDGILYGRGIMDDKGPMLACLYALKEIKDAGIKTERRIRLIFGTDEETGCHDVDRYLQTEEIPVEAFTPDADFPVIFSEKNLAVFNIRARLEELSAASESGKTSVQLTLAEAGDVPNKVPDKAKLVFSEIEDDIEYETEIETEDGVAAHGSRPDLGVNAIDIVINDAVESGLADELTGDTAAFFRFYDKYLLNDISGEKMGVNAKCPETGSTSMNPGVLKIVEDKGERKLELSVDYRTPASVDQMPLLGRIQALCEEYGLEFDIDHAKSGLHIPKASELVQKLSVIYGEETGLDPAPIAIGGGTYAKKLPNTVAFGPLMPGRTDTIHQANECFYKEDFELCRKIYKRAILDIAKVF